jgi:hypothetical protein
VLHLPDLFLKFHTSSMFVIIDIETVFQMEFVSMFIVYLNKEFEKPTSSGLLANHNKTES